MSYISNSSIDAHCGMMAEAGGVTGDFTVIARYRLPSFPSANSAVFIVTNAAVTNYVLVVIKTTGIINVQDSSAHTQDGSQLSVNTNYDVALVHRQGVSSILYVNGVNVAQITGITFTLDEWAIGVGGLSPNVAFQTNYPKSWTRAMTDAEVSNEVNNLGPQSSTSLWDWWILNSTPVDFLNGQVNGAGRQLKAQPDHTYFTNDASDLDIDALIAQALL